MDYNKHLDAVFRSPPSLLPANIGTNLHAGERVQQFQDHLWQQFLSTLTQDDFIRYPNDAELVSQLAAHHDISSQNIMLFAGADEALDCIVRCFASTGSQIVVPKYHFPMYDVYAARMNSTLVPLEYEGSTLTANTSIRIVTPRLTIVANPNSPVGDSPSITLLENLENLGVPIVIDSVYSDFGSTAIPISKLEKNYIFVHSFSKSFGGAGVRIGYVIANAAIISILSKVRPMAGITGPSIKFAQWALANLHLRDKYVQSIIETREKIKEVYLWNIGGNWVHLPSKYKKKLDDLNLRYKQCCSLPGVDVELIRVTASPALLSVL